ncbi:MAG: NADH-quinone oxidoreductase subunit A [Planctomycetaceae bacterium]|nr:NADH-quinone oxidoreductase subunit A [Planctomycetaceae bacterium]
MNAITQTSPTAIVAYLVLFATIGILFVFGCLLLGKFFRPRTPTALKLETYECGEPSVGPGTVQFDLRFYVVALLFLIFEVEVALFFPTATIFGAATKARREAAQTAVSTAAPTATLVVDKRDERTAISPESARTLALVSMIDLGAFFAVLLVGFAFIWRRGDLNWVRAVRHPATSAEANAAALRLRQDGFPT